MDERNVWGCDGTPGEAWIVPNEDSPRYGCPLAFVTPDLFETIAAWSTVKAHGLWPTDGGQDDQAAVFLDCVRVLDSLAGDFEKWQLQKSRSR